MGQTGPSSTSHLSTSPFSSHQIPLLSLPNANQNQTPKSSLCIIIAILMRNYYDDYYTAYTNNDLILRTSLETPKIHPEYQIKTMS